MLGITPAATPEAAREAWLALVKRWHPDRAPNPAQLPEYNRRMAEINAAYRLVSGA